MIKNSFFD